MTTMQLRYLATVSNSNVDKLTAPDEVPVRLCNYVDVYKNDRITNDMNFMSASATQAEISKYRLRAGDILITKDSEDRHDIAVPAYVAETAPDLVCGYHLSLVRARPNRVRGDFLFWALQSKQAREAFSNAAGGVTRFGLTLDGMKSVRLACPDLPIQKAIANFLDRETARIDQLIEKKQRLIILLNERSLAAIEEAISVSGRPSKLGHHIKIIPGYAFPSASFSTDDSDIRLLRGANVSPGAIRWDEVVYWPHELAGGLERFRLAAGDIVMGMDRPWVSGGIRVAELTSADVPSLLLQRVCKIIPLKTLAKEFLKLLLSSKKFLGYFEPELTGVSVPHISGDQIAGFRFPYIPVEEQIERARSCGAVLASNARILSVAEKSIERLREFRAALITASVTGQIEVATWGKRGQLDRRLDAIQQEMAS